MEECHGCPGQEGRLGHQATRMDQGLPVLEAARTQLRIGLYVQARTRGVCAEGAGRVESWGVRGNSA